VLAGIYGLIGSINPGDLELPAPLELSGRAALAIAALPEPDQSCLYCG
jgi:hypothetical protein